MADRYGVGLESMGYIADQTLLLADIKDGLSIYNREGTAEQLLNQICDRSPKQNLRVSQAPFRFRNAAEGATPEFQRSVFRLLYAPLNDYDLSLAYTVQGLQDMLPSDVEADARAAAIGDVELVLKLIYQRMMTPHTASVAGTQMATGNGFYNGELDVPRYRSNAFGSAHYHYAGLNTTTLTLAHITSMVKDIQEHGFGLTAGSLELHVNSQEAKVITDLAGFTATAGVASPERSTLAASGVIGFMGTLGGTKIMQDDWVPAGYLLMFDGSEKFMRCREHYVAAYRGLQLLTPNEAAGSAPLVGAYWLRRIGFTIGLLAAGTVRQLVGSTSYTTPTFDFT